MNYAIYNAAEEFEAVFEKLIKIQAKKITTGTPLYIQPYPILFQEEVEEQVDLLPRRLKKEGVEVLTVDLFKLCLDILRQEDNLLEDILENEQEISKSDLFDALCDILDVDIVVRKIKDLMESSQFDIVLLKNVAAMYPYLRSHNIINNIQNIIHSKPVVLFYPGRYNNEKLSLFDLLPDSNHYRAHNLKNIQIQK